MRRKKRTDRWHGSATTKSTIALSDLLIHRAEGDEVRSRVRRRRQVMRMMEEDSRHNQLMVMATKRKKEDRNGNEERATESTLMGGSRWRG